uniref:Uncharacterized protein n=1 Tax=Plectus sambesii TaxID=2011161 RepID=A0A914W4L9_9BILA
MLFKVKAEKKPGKIDSQIYLTETKERRQPSPNRNYASDKMQSPYNESSGINPYSQGGGQIADTAEMAYGAADDELILDIDDLDEELDGIEDVLKAETPPLEVEEEEEIEEGKEMPTPQIMTNELMAIREVDDS